MGLVLVVEKKQTKLVNEKKSRVTHYNGTDTRIIGGTFKKAKHSLF